MNSLLYVAPAALLAISVHEMAHGYMSDHLGDPTPRRDGRLSLNPFHHLDLWGTLCLIFFHIGWAKPVRVNAAYYRDKKKGMILVSLAGPVSNFLLAFLSMLLYGISGRFGRNASIGYHLQLLCYYSAILNVGLGLFNLIPCPPLDGSNVAAELFPGVRNFYLKIRRFSPLILVILVVSGILSRPLSALNDVIINGMWSVVRAILSFGISTGGQKVL